MDVVLVNAPNASGRRCDVLAFTHETRDRARRANRVDRRHVVRRDAQPRRRRRPLRPPRIRRGPSRQRTGVLGPPDFNSRWTRGRGTPRDRTQRSTRSSITDPNIQHPVAATGPTGWDDPSWPVDIAAATRFTLSVGPRRDGERLPEFRVLLVCISRRGDSWEVPVTFERPHQRPTRIASLQRGCASRVAAAPLEGRSGARNL
jgi:hypothetical protein